MPAFSGPGRGGEKGRVIGTFSRCSADVYHHSTICGGGHFEDCNERSKMSNMKGCLPLRPWRRVYDFRGAEFWAC
jgi:hypothetical protein